LSLLVMLIYVSFRFEWRFALASILALVHDSIIALGAISLFSVEVNLDILAAMLTLLGYSINDTIIVFDRIRENLQITKETLLENVINLSVSKTLSRTTLTSLTTLFVVATLLFFGGEIIYGFSFTLFVGIIVGTYSSIFVASTFLLQLEFSIEDFKAKEIVIYGFSFTLFVGIIVGTYSSIFVASTFLIQCKFSVEDFKIKEAEKLKREKEKARNRAMYEQGTV